MSNEFEGNSDIAVIGIPSSRKDGKEPLDDGNRPKPGEDRRMMLSPEYWPAWPILCLKNNRDRAPGGFPKFGLLYDRTGDDGKDDSRSFGFLEGVFLSQATNSQIKASQEADIDRLLADGWIVD